MNKKISIITVVKNGMPFLKSAIKSFKLQKYNNKELIIVYAPSKDGTEEYLESLNNPNIIIKKDFESTTKFGSINLGINISSGIIVGLLHSDDVFFNEKILDQITEKFNEEIDFLYGNVLFSKSDDLSHINRIWKSKKFNQKLLKFGWMPPHTSVFLRKDIFKDNNNFYNENFPISGDYDFTLNLLTKKNIKTLYLNEFISIMRSGGDSTKISNFLSKFYEDLNISKKYFKFNFICIFFKIFQKIFQLKIFNMKIKSNYIEELNKID